VSLIASVVLFTLAVLPLPASAWNIPGHMLSCCYHLPSVAVRSQRRANLSFPATCQVRKKQQPKVNPFGYAQRLQKLATRFPSDGR